MILILGLLLGVFLGFFLDVSIPVRYSPYLSVAIFACLDSVLGAIQGRLKNEFRTDIFISGFFGNAIIASLLTYLGDLLGMPIYLAAVIVFGSRIFNNFAIVRRAMLDKIRSKLGR